MHCPSCGNESSLDQKFCRRCGFDLEPVGKLVVQGADPDSLKVEKAERENLIGRPMFHWLACGLVIMGVGLLMLVANTAIGLGHAFGVFTILFLLAGIGMAAYGVIAALGKGASLPRIKTVPATDSQLNKGQTTRELTDPIPVPVPSVTERTTQLIGNNAKNDL